MAAPMAVAMAAVMAAAMAVAMAVAMAAAMAVAMAAAAPQNWIKMILGLARGSQDPDLANSWLFSILGVVVRKRRGY